MPLVIVTHQEHAVLCIDTDPIYYVFTLYMIHYTRTLYDSYMFCIWHIYLHAYTYAICFIAQSCYIVCLLYMLYCLGHVYIVCICIYLVYILTLLTSLYIHCMVHSTIVCIVYNAMLHVILICIYMIADLSYTCLCL